MVGQKKLLARLADYNINNIPKTIMFIGEKGSGKKTIAMNLAKQLNIEFIKIDTRVTAEDLNDYLFSPVKTLYLIDLSEFTEKQQNQFLKFIEEPSESVYVILIAESEIGILPTVLNRCTKYHMEQYAVEDLKALNWFTESLDDLVFTVCTTPGQVLAADSDSIKALHILCKKILANVSTTNYANTLAIANKINYAEEYNKFDFLMFFKMLEREAFELYRQTSDEASFKIYQFTNKFRQDLIGKTLVKETFMLNYLTKLWELTH